MGNIIPVTESDVQNLRRQAGQAEWRMRIVRVLETLPMTLAWASVAAAAVLSAKKLAPHRLSERVTWVALAVAGGMVFLVVLFAAFRRLMPRAGAFALDRHHRLAGRLPNALEFSERPADERSPMMSAAILDAESAVARGLSPRGAVPIRLPPELALSTFALAVLVGIALAEVRSVVVVPQRALAVSVESLDVSEDDLNLFRESLRQLAHDDQSPELREAIERFNRLIEDLSERRISREEAFRRMRALEDELTHGAQEDRDALKDALADMAKELASSELAKPSAAALEKHDLKTASTELKKLAERLKSREKPDKTQLERLKSALDRASTSTKKALEKLEEKRAELKTSLLKAKDSAESKPNDERAKSLLKKKERELERLERQLQHREGASAKLNRLERQLGRAAADLMRDLGVSAEELEKLTEDVNRLEQEETSDQEKDELRKRIEELRELIRQQGQGGDQLKKRLTRFMKQARGSQGGKGSEKGPGKGKRGKGKGGQGSEPGEDGDLRPGPGREPGDGEAEGEGEGQGKGLKLGHGGKSIPIEIPGGHGSASGSDGDEPGGSSSGHGSAPKLGKASDIDGHTVDVEAQGLDSGRGKSNAEVILGAAEQGFTGKAYQKVFKQYQTVAEAQVANENIPDGMRFYVRRYFQLIRPRD